jgi:hypothetical protein
MPTINLTQREIDLLVKACEAHKVAAEQDEDLDLREEWWTIKEKLKMEYEGD